MASPDWTRRRVIAYAHQGGSFEAPSSTLFAIERALANGATGIELDVHATADRRIVVCHDDTVDRTTGHAGSISDLTLDELREMDNAHWWIEGETATPGRDPSEYPLRGRAPADRSLGVATLEEVVRAFPGTLLTLDIKRTAPVVEPYEELLAAELARLGAQSSVMVASFIDEAIRRFRDAAPAVATSAASAEATDFFLSLGGAAPVVPPAQALQVPSTVGDVSVVDRRFVETAHAAGVAVHVWTINDLDEMEQLLDLGVDGIVSDRPSVLAAAISRRGLTWGGLAA
ncbi:MAG TPA: glycerophosphodiester phosphodiesterase [Acidimicrobiales bacterium]|nr:glycerophosphodiester phosphodiesterase [Acidimicrobiales bacterium]